MAGLLDMLGGYQDESAPASGGLDDPKIQGLLTAGLAMLGSRGNFAQALSEGGLAGLQSMQQGKQFAQTSAMRDMQLQQQRDAIEAQKRRQAWIQSIPSPQMGAAQAALGGGGGPTVANAAKMQPVDPTAQLLHGAVQAGVVSPEVWLQSQQKDNSPMVVKEGETLLDKRTLKPLFSNPKNDAPSEVKEYQTAKAQGYPGTFMQYQIEKRRAGATTVSVNTGQHGFDNEMKLGDKFKAEPVYKAYQEVQSAHSQVVAALRQANPVGDLAAATKIMKILDPGSVVRESELGMAMAASGLLDRVRNYAQMTMNGTKLTPQQRVEFRQMADALLSEAVGAYNSKRAEYDRMGSEWSLNSGRALGPAAKAPLPIPKPQGPQPGGKPAGGLEFLGFE